jgi:hypothetical protein
MAQVAFPGDDLGSAAWPRFRSRAAIGAHRGWLVGDRRSCEDVQEDRGGAGARRRCAYERLGDDLKPAREELNACKELGSHWG